MYVFSWPQSRVVAQHRYVARFTSPHDGRTHAVAMSPGRQYSTNRIPALGFVDESTIAYVQSVAPDGSTQILTPRARLGSLRRARGLSVESLYAHIDAKSKDQDGLTLAVDLLRWISDPQSSASVHRMTKHLATDGLARYRDESRSLLADLLDRGLGNDGSLISDALLYLHHYNQLLGCTEGQTWHSISNEMRPSTRNALQEMECTLRPLTLMPLNRALLVAIQSVLYGRECASETATWFRAAPAHTYVGPELGVRTYGQLGELPENACDPQFFDIVGDLTVNGSPRLTVLQSGDSKFLRAYAPRMLFFMQLFPEYNYHVCIIGPERTARETSDLLLELWDLSRRVRGVASQGALTMSYCDVPDDVRNPVSFYASARYLFAEKFLDKFPSGLWVQDVDLYPEADFTGHVPAMQKFDVAVPVSRVLAGIVPWKRYIANCVLFMPTPRSNRLLERVASYLRFWLVVDGSWMVDQNALTFGFEGEEGLSIYEVYSHRMPLRQSSLGARIEAPIFS